MATLVADAIASLKRMFPGIEPDSDTTISMEYINKAWRELCHIVPFHMQVTTVDITSGIQAYDLPFPFARIWHVEYRTSLTEATRLIASDWQTWNQEMPLWRYDGNSEPTRYAIMPGTAYDKIYLWPTPDTTTAVSTYPRLDVYTSSTAELLVGDSFPETMRNPDVLILRAAWRYSLDQNNERKGELERISKELEQKELQAFLDRDVKSPRAIRPRFYMPTIRR